MGKYTSYNGYFRSIFCPLPSPLLESYSPQSLVPKKLVCTSHSPQPDLPKASSQIEIDKQQTVSEDMESDIPCGPKTQISKIETEMGEEAEGEESEIDMEEEAVKEEEEESDEMSSDMQEDMDENIELIEEMEEEETEPELEYECSEAASETE